MRIKPYILAMTAPLAPQRTPALLLTLLLHLGLFAALQKAQQAKPLPPSVPMQWLTLLSLRTPAVNPAPAPAPPTKPTTAAARPTAARTIAPLAAAPVAAVDTTADDDKDAALPIVAPLEATGRSAADIMRQAKRDLGKIDRDIRAADAKWVRAPASTPHSRMQAAFDAAKDAVPPKWYEASRITPIGVQAGSGARMYKVVSAFGTYCIRVASNHSLADMLPKGDSKQDQMSTGIRPTFATCPQ